MGWSSVSTTGESQVQSNCILVSTCRMPCLIWHSQLKAENNGFVSPSHHCPKFKVSHNFFSGITSSKEPELGRWSFVSFLPLAGAQNHALWEPRINCDSQKGKKKSLGLENTGSIVQIQLSIMCKWSTQKMWGRGRGTKPADYVREWLYIL